MTNKQLVEILFEVEKEKEIILNISIYDEMFKSVGILSLLPNGEGFKVYIENDADGKNDYIIFHNPESLQGYEGSLTAMCINGVPENRLKLISINNALSMQPIMLIDEYLTAEIN